MGWNEPNDTRIGILKSERKKGQKNVTRDKTVIVYL